MLTLQHLYWLHYSIQVAVEGLVHAHWELHSHSCRNGSHAVQASQARRPSTTYRWYRVRTQERAGLHDWLTDWHSTDTAWGDWLWFTHQLDRAQWRDSHPSPFQLWTSSSHLVWVVLVYHQLPFVDVYKAPIGTLQYPCFLQLLSQQPLQTFVKGFLALQTAGANSEQWTVQNDLWYNRLPAWRLVYQRSRHRCRSVRTGEENKVRH